MLVQVDPCQLIQLNAWAMCNSHVAGRVDLTTMSSTELILSLIERRLKYSPLSSAANLSVPTCVSDLSHHGGAVAPGGLHGNFGGRSSSADHTGSISELSLPPEPIVAFMGSYGFTEASFAALSGAEPRALGAWLRGERFTAHVILVAARTLELMQAYVDGVVTTAVRNALAANIPAPTQEQQQALAAHVRMTWMQSNRLVSVGVPLAHIDGDTQVASVQPDTLASARERLRVALAREMSVAREGLLPAAAYDSAAAATAAEQLAPATAVFDAAGLIPYAAVSQMPYPHVVSLRIPSHVWVTEISVAVRNRAVAVRRAYRIVEETAAMEQWERRGHTLPLPAPLLGDGGRAAVASDAWGQPVLADGTVLRFVDEAPDAGDASESARYAAIASRLQVERDRAATKGTDLRAPPQAPSSQKGGGRRHETAQTAAMRIGAAEAGVLLSACLRRLAAARVDESPSVPSQTRRLLHVRHTVAARPSASWQSLPTTTPPQPPLPVTTSAWVAAAVDVDPGASDGEGDSVQPQPQPTAEAPPPTTTVPAAVASPPSADRPGLAGPMTLSLDALQEFSPAEVFESLEPYVAASSLGGAVPVNEPILAGSVRPRPPMYAPPDAADMPGAPAGLGLYGVVMDSISSDVAKLLGGAHDMLRQEPAVHGMAATTSRLNQQHSWAAPSQVAVPVSLSPAFDKLLHIAFAALLSLEADAADKEERMAAAASAASSASSTADAAGAPATVAAHGDTEVPTTWWWHSSMPFDILLRALEELEYGIRAATTAAADAMRRAEGATALAASADFAARVAAALQLPSSSRGVEVTPHSTAASVALCEGLRSVASLARVMQAHLESWRAIMWRVSVWRSCAGAPLGGAIGNGASAASVLAAAAEIFMLAPRPLALALAPATL